MRVPGCLFVSLGLAATIGCNTVEDGASGGGDEVEGCAVVLRAGTDDRDAIQTALSEAADNSTICFSGSFEITTDQMAASDKVGLTLRGIDAGDEVGAGAVFDFKDLVGPTGFKFSNMQGITLENFTVKNVKGDGLEVRGSTDVVFRKMKVTWERGASNNNGAYGFYPVESTNVLVEDCEASNTADAGIYVGQSENIVVRRNVVFANVSGIQVENSRNIEVHDNEAYDNTLGIFVHDLPAVPAGNGEGALVRDNMVYDNNRDNFAKEGIIAAVIPPGLGIMVMTMDDVEVTGNTVEGHDSVGIAVVSYKTVELLDPPDREPDPDYDPYPETLHIHGNTLSGNGDAPAQLFVEAFGLQMMADIGWDGVADASKDDADGRLKLCIHDNGAADFVNFDSLNLGANKSFDLAPHACEHPARPTVDNGLLQ